MIRIALAALIALAAAPAAAQIAVKGEWVALGDVTPVTGEAAKVLLAPAPPPGEKLALDPAFVIAVARRSGVVLALSLDQPLWVTRTATVAPALTAPRPLAARTAPQAKQAPQPPMVASAEAPEGWVLVFARDIERGGRVGEGDLQWADPASVRAGRLPPEDIDVALGLEARRNLKAGAPVQMSDLKAPAVIRKGDPVKLVYASPGISLSVDGLAQNEAAAGGNVRILNSFTKRAIDAIAVAEGEARVLKR